MKWFDSDPERASIKQEDKDEMLSVIGRELWTKIMTRS